MKRHNQEFRVKKRAAREKAQFRRLERQFPESCAVAFRAAKEQALQSGLAVLEASDGIIYKIIPDGSREEVKRISPPQRVSPGTRIKLR